MTKQINDFATLLVCKDKNAIATKTFTEQPDGTVVKENYKAGVFFNAFETPITSLQEFYDLLIQIKDTPTIFLIRGKLKDSASKIVYRRIHGELAAFKPASHHWVVLDFDKIPLPDFVKVIEDKIKWVIQQLPKPFHDVDCICKLSSSYGIDRKSNSFSGHIVFILDKPYSDEELKAYFKQNNSLVDLALFNPVQIHFTAKPIFKNMADPVENRIFLLRGVAGDFVTLPPIKIETKQSRISLQTIDCENLTEEKIQEALIFISRFYPKEGGRHRFSGALIATLLRHGLGESLVAEFIHALALMCNDDEAHQRESNTYSIKNALENGQNVQGIPTLISEFSISKDEINEFLTLLDIGEPDIHKAIGALSNNSTIEEIKQVIEVVAILDEAQHGIHIDSIKNQTKQTKGALSSMLKSVMKEAKNNNLDDPSYKLALSLLALHYNNGKYLMLLKDGCYWSYNSKFWEIVNDNLIRKKLLTLAETEVTDTDNLEKVISNSLKLLKGMIYRDDDPLHFTATPPNAFNVMNGEIWFNEDGSGYTIKPHSPDSGFRYCMDAYYNPEAKAPKFEQFESGIFRDNSQSEDCINLMREILAYACMEWKNIATIVILHGEGGNGKTRYGVLLQKLLGEKFIHSGDVSSIEKNRFQLASLVNKKVFIDDDVKQGIILADGTLKKISEKKAQTAEHKNKDPFDFVLNLVPILMTNHLIRVNDKSNGMKRRLVTVPFKREFLPHEQVINLIENIWEAESSGVLNLIIEAGLNLMQRKRFNPPLECEELRNQFLNLDTPLNEYINNTHDRIDEKYVGFEEFLNGFTDYHNIVATLDTTFKQSIEDSLNRAGFEVKNHSNKRFIKGLAPKMLALEGRL